MSLEVIGVINKVLYFIIKKLVNLLYRRTRFLTWSWGIDEHTDINIISEESYLDRHRFGLHEEVFKE